MRFCLRRNVQYADAEDIVQGVFVRLAQALPKFQLDHSRGRFRDYLFRCVRNAIFHHRQRPTGAPFELHHLEKLDADAVPCDRSAEEDRQVWEQEWVDHHYRLALETLRASADARSIELFNRSIEGATPAELAKEYSMSPDAVYKARQRLRDRLEALIALQIRDEDSYGDQSSGA